MNFLREILATNAINFSQDRSAKGFTFNYYLANVRFRLAEYKDDYRNFSVDKRLLKKGKLSDVKPTERWRRYQEAFEDAIKHFTVRLELFMLSKRP